MGNSTNISQEEDICYTFWRPRDCICPCTIQVSNQLYCPEAMILLNNEITTTEIGGYALYKNEIRLFPFFLSYNNYIFLRCRISIFLVKWRALEWVKNVLWIFKHSSSEILYCDKTSYFYLVWDGCTLYRPCNLVK